MIVNNWRARGDAFHGFSIAENRPIVGTRTWAGSWAFRADSFA